MVKQSPSGPGDASRWESLRTRMVKAGAVAGISPTVSEPTWSNRRRKSTALLRAKRLLRRDEGEALMTLAVDPQGVLRWHPGAVGTSQLAGKRRGARRGPTPETLEIIDQYSFETVGLSDVHKFLSHVDGKLTPRPGVWHYRDGGLKELSQPIVAGERILLVIHGTFSNSENFVACLRETVTGATQSFLDWAQNKYAAVLFFSHPTLSRSPLLNALELCARLPTGVTYDILCHSRGGLVARWWYEVLNRAAGERGKVVFVGSPLAGTSLAAPDRVRATIDYLTNVGNIVNHAIGAAANLVPFLSVAQVLMSLVCSAMSLAAKTPVADAVIALVPGLDAQSRVQNAPELTALRARALANVADNYFAVVSSFRPTDPGWAFWRYFTEAGKRLKAAAADIVFPGPHDLVVDRSSMGDLGHLLTIPKAHCLDFGTNDSVHHNNYLDFKRTVDFIVRTLT